MREQILAALLALAGVLVTTGVHHFSSRLAWVVAGLLLGAWAWLVVPE